MLQQTHTWNEATHARAVKMWSDGASLTEVAAYFSISRSAVSGYISRNRSAFPPRRKDVRNDGKPIIRKPASAWTEDRITEAARLWKAGWKQEEIAETFGVSKAAFANVIMRYRARFPFVRDLKNRHAPKPRQPRRVVPENLNELFDQAESKSAYDGRRFILSDHPPVQFASLKAAQCKFPVSAPDEPCGPDMLCCGSQRETGLSYCAAHYAVAHRRDA